MTEEGDDRWGGVVSCIGVRGCSVLLGGGV